MARPNKKATNKKCYHYNEACSNNCQALSDCNGCQGCQGCKFFKAKDDTRHLAFMESYHNWHDKTYYKNGTLRSEPFHTAR